MPKSCQLPGCGCKRDVGIPCRRTSRSPCKLEHCSVSEDTQSFAYLLGMPCDGHQRLVGLIFLLLALAHVRADHAFTPAEPSLPYEHVNSTALGLALNGGHEPPDSGPQAPFSSPRPPPHAAWQPVQYLADGVSTLYNSELHDCWTR